MTTIGFGNNCCLGNVVTDAMACVNKCHDDRHINLAQIKSVFPIRRCTFTLYAIYCVYPMKCNMCTYLSLQGVFIRAYMSSFGSRPLRVPHEDIVALSLIVCLKKNLNASRF